ncbi:hypothetical protein D3C76_929600 [compost metagenome]
MTDGFAGTVRKLRHRLAVTFHQFNHDIQRFYLGDIAGQACANTKAQVNAGRELAIKIDRF